MPNATIRVQFGLPDAAERTGHLSAELDTRENGLNGGRTSFNPGDTAYILVYKSDNVQIEDVVCSSGSITRGQEIVVDVEDEIFFEDSDTATLNKPCQSTALSSTRWFGRSLGSLSLQSDKMTVKASAKGVAVAKVGYRARAIVYALTSPASIDGETDFSILVVIKGTVAA